MGGSDSSNGIPPRFVAFARRYIGRVPLFVSPSRRGIPERARSFLVSVSPVRVSLWFVRGLLGSRNTPLCTCLVLRPRRLPPLSRPFVQVRVLSSSLPKLSTAAIIKVSRLNSGTHSLAVYASSSRSPVSTQDSLLGCPARLCLIVFRLQRVSIEGFRYGLIASSFSWLLLAHWHPFFPLHFRSWVARSPWRSSQTRDYRNQGS
jgi:hypothetical protein